MDPENHSGPQHHKLMAVLSYVGILVVIPIILAKDDPFVKFHIKQGLVLLGIEIITWVVVGMFIWQLWMLVHLVNLAVLVLAIVGIVNAVQGKQKELPIVGSLAHSIPL